MSWIYWQSEENLWTVGDNAGHTDSDHTDCEKAARRCAWLNGGDGKPYPAQFADPEEELREIDELKTRCLHLEDRLARQSARLTAMERLQDGPLHTRTHEKIEQLTQSIQRLNALENRINIVHDGLETLGNSHQELQADVETHEAQIDKLEHIVGELQEGMSDKVDEDDFNDIEKEVAELKEKIEEALPDVEDIHTRLENLRRMIEERGNRHAELVDRVEQEAMKLRALEQWAKADAIHTQVVGGWPLVKHEAPNLKPLPMPDEAISTNEVEGLEQAQVPCFGCDGFHAPSELKPYTRMEGGVRQAASFCPECIETNYRVKGRGWEPVEAARQMNTTCQCTFGHICPGRASSGNLCTQPATVRVSHPSDLYYQEGRPVCQACAEAYVAKGWQRVRG